jgi:arylsulfatase A-like enzyme
MYSDTVNAEVRRYFDAHPLAGPEFVYVHYIDVHGRKESADRWRDAPFEPGYESAVRYVDGKVRELYEYFSARYGGELLFVVTSDHGQDLDDDLAVGDDRPLRKRKASLHDFNLRIPCYILPSPLVSPRVIAEPTSNVDVAPTLLAWLGLAPLGPGPGVSLLDALRGQPYDGEGRSLYARNTTGQRFEEGVVHAHTKLVRYRDPLDGTVKIRRMVDLEKDPRELEGLPQDTSAAEALLDREAEAGGLESPARFEELDDAMRAQLDDMGYGGDEDESKRR